MTVETSIKSEEEVSNDTVKTEDQANANELDTNNEREMRTISMTEDVKKPKKEVIKYNDNKKVETKNTKKIHKKGLFKRLSQIGTVSKRDVVEFTRHLSVMLNAGVTIFEAISFLKDESKNKVFTNRLESILDSLNNGQSLSVSMKRYPKIFPEIYTNIMHVGEQSGSLPETMIDLADHLEENEKFKRKVKGALIYPKIILSVMGLFLLALFLFVMPRILKIFQSLNAEIPTATKITMNITSFVQNNILFIGLTILGIIIGLHFLFKNATAQKARDLAYIKMPLIGHIILNYNTTQFAQHFGTLFASGLTIVKCLEITGSVMGNRIFRDEVEYMVNKIRNGSSLSQSFPDNSHFPPMLVKLIRVGERTGKLPDVVNYMKNYYKGLVDADVKNITTIIEPVIMVLLGLMVAGLVITVIGPIYQLIANVGQ